MSYQKERLDELPKLTETSRLRTKAGRLRELFDEIAAAQAAGYRLEAIVESLSTQQLEISLDTLKTSLKRIRKKQNEVGIKPIQAPKKDSTCAQEKLSHEAKHAITHQTLSGFTKEGYRHPLQTFVRDVTKRRNWDENHSNDETNPNDTTVKRDHISKEGYRDPMPTFTRDVTKRLNLDE